jgi:hypothetical protein
MESRITKAQDIAPPYNTKTKYEHKPKRIAHNAWENSNVYFFSRFSEH